MAAGLPETAFSRIAIWPLMSDFGLRAEFRHVDAEILAGLARAGEHDLPVEGGRVLHDDGNGGLLGKSGGAEADGCGHEPGKEPGLLHGGFLSDRRTVPDLVFAGIVMAGLVLTGLSAPAEPERLF